MFTAPNGMNLRKSVHNPNSRFSRVMEYLTKNGPSTKRQILRDVFGLEPYPIRVNHGTTLYDGKPPRFVSMGWGSYLFTLGVKYGYLQKVRKYNTTFWYISPSTNSTK